MLKTIRDMLLGAFVAAAVGYAHAVVGVAPLSGGGPALIDQSYLLGLANGQNFGYVSGVTAAGTTQATATALPTGALLVEVDTTASSTGVNLPPALKGTAVFLYNNGANTLTIFPAVANNPITAAQDTINNGTSTTQATHVSKIYYCAKDGVWAAQ